VIGTLFLLTCVLTIVDIYFKMLDSDWPPNVGDLLNKATYLSISLLVGAGVVNRLLEGARKEQWDEIRMMTYKSILYHICNITALTSLNLAEIEKTEPKLFQFLRNEEAIIGKDTGSPSKDIGASIILLSQLLTLAIQKRNKELDSGEPWRIDVDLMRRYYELVLWRLDNIRDILIPRVLMLSNNKKLCDALIRFDWTQTRYDEEMRFRIRMWDANNAFDKETVRHPEILALLVEAAGYVYMHIYEDFDPDKRMPGIPGGAKYDKEALEDTSGTATQTQNGVKNQTEDEG